MRYSKLGTAFCGHVKFLEGLELNYDVLSLEALEKTRYHTAEKQGKRKRILLDSQDDAIANEHFFSAEEKAFTANASRYRNIAKFDTHGSKHSLIGQTTCRCETRKNFT